MSKEQTTHTEPEQNLETDQHQPAVETNGPNPASDEAVIDEAVIEEIPAEELIQRLTQDLEQTQLKAENYYRKLLRMEADFDNFRRRTREEKEELQLMAAEKVITNLLPVLDNMERGLAAAEQTCDFESLRSGLQLVYRGLQDILKREGLEAIEAVGQQFDPNYHEAMLRVPLAEGQSDNTVTEELQRGYKLKGKVIRPARVAVARDIEE
jgi:molecular chaperone GrpE